MNPASARLLYWSPRILTIGFALFISLFALDVFSEHASLGRTILDLSVHLIPSLAIAAVLIAAWRREWIGAALLILAAGLYAATVLPRHPDWALLISGPLLAIAGLFLLNWILRSKLRAAL